MLLAHNSSSVDIKLVAMPAFSQVSVCVTTGDYQTASDSEGINVQDL